MTTLINASASSGLVQTADTSAILGLQTNGTTALTIDTSANIGIGTTSPGAKFSLTSTGSTTADGVRLTFGSEARAHNIYSALPTGRDLTIAPYRALTINTGSGTAEGVLGLNAYEYTTFGTGSSYTERMRIASTGEVGIGTTATSSKLCVSSEMSLLTDGNNRGIIGWDNTDKRISFGTINASTAYFNAMSLRDGNLLVGKTATGISTVGTIITATGEIQLTRDGASSLLLNRLTNDGAVAGFRRSGTEVGTISVTTTATAYNTSSDYRLKENIMPMTGALAKVAQLKPVTYKWKVDGSNGEGFIAHELAEVKPDCVSGDKDGVEAYKDDDGNEQTRPKYQGIDTSFLVATLTAALQELKAINDTQAETINALTARIVALEGV